MKTFWYTGWLCGNIHEGEIIDYIPGTLFFSAEAIIMVEKSSNGQYPIGRLTHISIDKLHFEEKES